MLVKRKTKFSMECDILLQSLTKPQIQNEASTSSEYDHKLNESLQSWTSYEDA